MTSQLDTISVNNSMLIATSSRLKQRILIITSLILVDLVTILVGFRLAYSVRFESGITIFFQHAVSPLDFYKQFVFFLAPIFIIVFALFGLYELKNLFAGTREYTLVFNACTLGVMLIILFSFFDPDFVIARAWVILSWLLVTLTVILGRFTFRRAIHRLRANGHLMSAVLVIGANEEGIAIAQQLSDNPKAGVKIIGFVDDHIQQDKEPATGISMLGTINSTIALAQKHNVQEVIIASTALTREQLFSLVQSLHNANITPCLSSGLYEILTTGVEVQDVGNIPLLSVNKVRLTGSDTILKRMLDLMGATAALMLFLPIMILIATAVKLDSSGPVFYRRKVVGVGGKEFFALKFRTMCVDADDRLAKDAGLRKQFEQNFKLKNDPRVTRVGQFLRSSSLDELPQLINVLFGQMSLVGPRMITKPERAYYGKLSMNLFTVKPGITGLWQISGRSNVSYSERVKLDMQYIRNYSIWLDLYILWQTIPAVIKGRGAY